MVASLEACFMAWATRPAISLDLSLRRCSTTGRSGDSPPGWSTARTEAPHYQLDRATVQLAEDAGANVGDKENPELLQVGVAVQGPGKHLLRGDEDAKRWGAGGRRAGVLFP